MDNTFTFYKRGIFSRSVDVYSGDISDRPKPKKGKGPLPEYSIKVCSHKVQFRSREQPMLSGSNHNLSGNRDNIGDAMTIRVISDGYRFAMISFVYCAKRYNWYVYKTGNGWILVNIHSETLAVFDRTTNNMYKKGVGVYRIEADADENLKRLVLCICEVIYLTGAFNRAMFSTTFSATIFNAT